MFQVFVYRSPLKMNVLRRHTVCIITVCIMNHHRRGNCHHVFALRVITSGETNVWQEFVDQNTALSACLPSLQDEGIFPLALLMHLAEEHNRIVRRTREVGAAKWPETDPCVPCAFVCTLQGMQSILTKANQRANINGSSRSNRRECTQERHRPVVQIFVHKQNSSE